MHSISLGKTTSPAVGSVTLLRKKDIKEKLRNFIEDEVRNSRDRPDSASF